MRSTFLSTSLLHVEGIFAIDLPALEHILRPGTKFFPPDATEVKDLLAGIFWQHGGCYLEPVYPDATATAHDWDMYCKSIRDMATGTYAVPHDGGGVYCKLEIGEWVLVSKNVFSLSRVGDQPPDVYAQQTGDIAPLVGQEHNQTLSQDDYANEPGHRLPEQKFSIFYDDVPLVRALGGDTTGLDDPAFAENALIGDKLSICTGLRLASPHNGFVSKQHNAWINKKTNRTAVSRGKLAGWVAKDIHAIVTANHPITHNAEVVTFDRLVLKELQLKSKSTFQPVIGILPALITTPV
ncbi:hypothetical protein C8Q79DRAFT_1011795 [Trametes meyenii]|nr:hypothetical protein C8Q79DRAFT_1011795 [Trametes meyenii]